VAKNKNKQKRNKEKMTWLSLDFSFSPPFWQQGPKNEEREHNNQ
jgi:hypothetical protein